MIRARLLERNPEDVGKHYREIELPFEVRADIDSAPEVLVWRSRMFIRSTVLTDPAEVYYREASSISTLSFYPEPDGNFVG